MTILGRALRNLLERVLGRFHEGPDAPPRVGQEVRLFRALHPDATADDWEAFAAAHASNAYRQGYVRGYDYSERFWPGPIDDPAVLLAHSRESRSMADGNPRLKTILELGYDPADPFLGISLTDRKVMLKERLADKRRA